MAQACRLTIQQHFIYPLFTPRAVQGGDEVCCLQAEVSPAEAPPKHTWWDSGAASDCSKKQRGTTLTARQRCGEQGHSTPRGRTPWGCPATPPLPGTGGAEEPLAGWYLLQVLGAAATMTMVEVGTAGAAVG